MKRPRSGLFAGVRSLPFWLRAVWPGGERAAAPRESSEDSAADEIAGAPMTDEGAPTFEASLIPLPRWPRLRAGVSAALVCRSCSVCVAVCPSHALDASDEAALVLDLGRCIGCGICVERCPASALELAKGGPVLFAPLGEERLPVTLGERSPR